MHTKKSNKMKRKIIITHNGINHEQISQSCFFLKKKFMYTQRSNSNNKMNPQWQWVVVTKTTYSSSSKSNEIECSRYTVLSDFCWATKFGTNNIY